MSRDFSHPGDDVVFVRRCRIVTVGVMRLAAVVLAWRTVESVLQAVTDLYRFQTLAGGSGLPMVAVVALGAMVGSAVMLWFLAPWISRRIFPAPPSRTQCPKCKYPIGDLDADTCPECGARVR